MLPEKKDKGKKLDAIPVVYSQDLSLGLLDLHRDRTCQIKHFMFPSICCYIITPILFKIENKLFQILVLLKKDNLAPVPQRVNKLANT